MFPFLLHSCRLGIRPHPWRCEHPLHLIPVRNRAREEHRGDAGDLPSEAGGSVEAADGHVPQGRHGVSDRPGSFPLWKTGCGRVWRLLVRVVPQSPTTLQGLWVEAQQGLERESCAWGKAAVSSPRVKQKGGGGSEEKKKTNGWFRFCQFRFCQFFLRIVVRFLLSFWFLTINKILDDASVSISNSPLLPATCLCWVGKAALQRRRELHSMPEDQEQNEWKVQC